MKALSSLTCMWCVVALYASQGVAQLADIAPEDEVVEIPLEELWAWEMPGTKDIQQLKDERTSRSGRGLVHSITEL